MAQARGAVSVVSTGATRGRRSGQGLGGEAGHIGGGTRIRGRVHGEGDLVVAGTVEGPIQLRGDLTIEHGGAVTADVDALNIVVAGTLEGDVSASHNVRIASGARVRGNVKGAAVSIEDGAAFAGQLDCVFDLPPELSGSGGKGRR